LPPQSLYEKNKEGSDIRRERRHLLLLY